MFASTLPQTPAGNVFQESAEYFAGLKIELAPAVSLSHDQFFKLCQQNRNVRIERTAKGELVFMAPSGGETSLQNMSLGGQLFHWARNDGTGKAFDSNGGFRLPNGAVLSPDASWITKDRLSKLTEEEFRGFIPLCPDFVAELLSPSDSLRATEEKMQEYIENGARLGWLLNPRNKSIAIYRPASKVETLDNPSQLTGDPVLNGFVLDVLAVWNP